MPATSLTVSFSSGVASNARPYWYEQQLLPATYIRRKARDGSVPRSSRSFSAATGVISIIATPLSAVGLGIMLTRRPASREAPRLRDGLEAVGARVAAVEEAGLRPIAAHRDDLVHGRDPPAGRLPPVPPQRTDIHDDRDPGRLLVRHAVAAADDVDRLVGAGGVKRRRQRDVVADAGENASDRGAPDVAGCHGVLADLRD